jgi:hypothetical protein
MPIGASLSDSTPLGSARGPALARPFLLRGLPARVADRVYPLDSSRRRSGWRLRDGDVSSTLLLQPGGFEGFFPACESLPGGVVLGVGIGGQEQDREVPAVVGGQSPPETPSQEQSPKPRRRRQPHPSRGAEAVSRGEANEDPLVQAPALCRSEGRRGSELRARRSPATSPAQYLAGGAVSNREPRAGSRYGSTRRS